MKQETCCDVVHHDVVNDCIEHLSEPVVESLSETFKAVTDPTRIRILYNLSKRELCGCDLAEVLRMPPSAVSHQLVI
jgi:DNA-binding transcriptional ArsR family regulator